MSAKLLLVLMTAVAVVSDSALHPFYPQYFSEVFGVSEPRHVGFYIGSCSLTVLLSFPFWAQLSRRVEAMALLLGTQIVTGVLSLVCATLTSLTAFWVVSLLMMIFKASYLLIYPHCMSLEEKRDHLGTISLLALVVYFGNVLSAALSGLLFELVEPRFLFVAMAIGDALQTLLCWLLLRHQRASATTAPSPTASPKAESANAHGLAWRLGTVMLVLYFAAYVAEPFFAAYWEQLSNSQNRLVSGIVFAIPGVAALLGLVWNARQSQQGAPPSILPAIALALLGIAAQAVAEPLTVSCARFVYGWALFQAMVRLDLLLFQHSERGDYSVDFSKINLFQGLGVLLASFAAGSIASSFGARFTFAASALAFALGAGLYLYLFRETSKLSAPSSSPRAHKRIGALT